jgi:hypothetical protein
MGQLTRAEIVTEGLEMAGNTGLTTRANVWLNLWLSKVYTQWPWAFLQNHYGPISVAVGTQKVTFGAGQNTDDRIHTIRRALLTDPVSGVVSTELQLRSSSSVNALDILSGVSATNYGQPRVLHVVPSSTAGQWELYFSPRPAVATRLVLVAHFTPDHLSADSDVPSYPNDETMMFAVYVAALRHQQDERWQSEAAELRRMIAADRSVHGGGADVVGPVLSHTRFGGGPRQRNWLEDP